MSAHARRIFGIETEFGVTCAFEGQRKLSPDEVAITWKLRRALAGLDPQQALEVVLGKLKETSSNVEFLVQMQKSIPAPASGGHSHGHENSIR